MILQFTPGQHLWDICPKKQGKRQSSDISNPLHSGLLPLGFTRRGHETAGWQHYHTDLGKSLSLCPSVPSCRGSQLDLGGKGHHRQKPQCRAPHPSSLPQTKLQPGTLKFFNPTLPREQAQSTKCLHAPCSIFCPASPSPDIIPLHTPGLPASCPEYCFHVAALPNHPAPKSASPLDTGHC